MRGLLRRRSCDKHTNIAKEASVGKLQGSVYSLLLLHQRLKPQKQTEQQRHKPMRVLVTCIHVPIQAKEYISRHVPESKRRDIALAWITGAGCQWGVYFTLFILLAQTAVAQLGTNAPIRVAIDRTTTATRTNVTCTFIESCACHRGAGAILGDHLRCF